MPKKPSATRIVQSLTACLTPVMSRQQCFVKECRKLHMAAKSYQRLTTEIVSIQCTTELALERRK